MDVSSSIVHRPSSRMYNGSQSTQTGNAMATLPDDIESSIEDLDPEPAQRGWTRWREVVLGVLLVLGVLGWSGWSWWQQQRNESNYRIAQEAAIRRDWDVARMYYADTPGYKDADSKATQAGKMIADRD